MKLPLTPRWRLVTQLLVLPQIDGIFWEFQDHCRPLTPLVSEGADCGLWVSTFRREIMRMSHATGERKHGQTCDSEHCLHRCLSQGEVTVRRSRRASTHSYMSGSRSSVRAVDVSRPPTTTVASGRCVSAPIPCESSTHDA
jgi:hypothetical protein